MTTPEHVTVPLGGDDDLPEEIQDLIDAILDQLDDGDGKGEDD
jgi:hypothetical protein